LVVWQDVPAPSHKHLQEIHAVGVGAMNALLLTIASVVQEQQHYDLGSRKQMFI